MADEFDRQSDLEGLEYLLLRLMKELHRIDDLKAWNSTSLMSDLRYAERMVSNMYTVFWAQAHGDEVRKLVSWDYEVIKK